MKQRDSSLEHCILRGLEESKRLLERRRIPLPTYWDTPEWQYMKRLIASSIARCLCSLGCRVYLGDFHGGEPSEGLGGKDIDIIIDCSAPEGAVKRLEEQIEAVVAGWLRSLLGQEPYTALGIPNIVEIHTTNEFLFKKYVDRGTPYVVPLC